MSAIDPSKVDVQALINAAEQYLATYEGASNDNPVDDAYFEDIFKEALGLNPKVSELEAAVFQYEEALKEQEEAQVRVADANLHVRVAAERLIGLLHADYADIVGDFAYQRTGTGFRKTRVRR